MTEIYNNITKPELIMGLICLLGALAMSLQKLGLVNISFRKNEKGDSGKCPDPACSANVGYISAEVKDLNNDFKNFKREIFKRMDKASQDISYIRGRLKNGYD